jgi:dipeptidyl-peptidase-4
MKMRVLGVGLIGVVSCGSPPPPAAPANANTNSSATSSANTNPNATATATPVVDRDFIRAFSKSRRFTRGAPRDATITPDGRAVLFLRSQPRDTKQSLFETDVASGATRELLSPDALDKAPEHLTQEERARRERMRITSSGFTSFALGKDGRTLIVVLSGKLYALDRASGKAHAIDIGKGAAVDPQLSPDGKLVAFVQDDDVHVATIDGSAKPRPITKGGNDAKPHGLADFIAAEELDRARGFWWSPDSRSILFEEADTKGVEILTIADPAHPETPADRVAYPRPGHANATLRFGIAALTGSLTWIDWDRAQFPYVAQVDWSEHAPPTLVVFDRLQKNEVVLAADERTGKTRELMREHDDAWVNDDPSVPRWLPDGSAFLWTSERDGDWRLGLVPAKDAASTKWLTPRGMQVESVEDVDATKRRAVFSATSDGLRHQLMRVSLDGGDATAVAKIDDGDVYASFTDGQHDAFVAHEASMAGVHRVVVRAIDGGASQEIPSLAENPTLPRVEHEDVGPDAVHVAIVRPRSYVPGARYPLIDSAYAGPHAQVVSVDPRQMLLEQWMADATGAIVVKMDTKGTPGRGRAWERVLAGKLGDVPLDGHVAAIQAFVAAHPEIDGTRIGVYGWSFGGYFAATAVLRRPDVFSAGVAIAPGCDWRDYDTGYAERYLGLPDTNAAAYDAASLLTYARQPLPTSSREPALLIVHGTADDNVFFVNSMKLVDALEHSGRSFTFLPFLGQTHQIASPEDLEVVWSRAAKTLHDGLAK